MSIILCAIGLILVHGSLSEPSPYYYGAYNPYVKFYEYGQTNHLSPYTPYNPIRHVDPYPSIGGSPTFNVLAEVPFTIGNTFTVVPMVVVSKQHMRVISKGEIMTVSKQKPQMTLKTDHNKILDCTPAVKIVLDTPIVVYSLKSNIVFPSLVEIVHQSYKIPIRVGAVVAPVSQDTFVSIDTPIYLNVVYAVPSEPIQIDYVNNQGVSIHGDEDSITVESSAPELPPKNVTILDFPSAEAEPVLQVDEEDEVLDNRNNPIILAPAGIVQSTQPQAYAEPFANAKESPILILLREESKRKRI